MLPVDMFAASLAPLAASTTAIKIHVAAATGAFLIGVWQMLGRKGTVPHRTLGWVWVGLMAVVAVSSFFITGFAMIGPFSPIHLLSILVLVQLPIAVRAARHHRVTLHSRMMTGMFAVALVVTGLFTLLPGRIMHRVLFG